MPGTIIKPRHIPSDISSRVSSSSNEQVADQPRKKPTEPFYTSDHAALLHLPFAKLFPKLSSPSPVYVLPRVFFHAFRYPSWSIPRHETREALLAFRVDATLHLRSSVQSGRFTIEDD